MPKKLPRTKSHKLRTKSSGFLLLGLACLLVALVFSVFKSNFDIFRPCANSISCIKDLSGKFEPNATGIFMGQRIIPPAYIADRAAESRVLGENSASKHIYVDLTSQTLYAYEGDQMKYTYPVSTGKWGRTPTGDFTIWIKLRYTRMSGGSGADYYNLPNVPYTMFYYNDKVAKSDGYSIHGAYWHNNFGHPMSHGCVNMRPADAAKIYDWASPVTGGNVTKTTAENPGTVVTVYGTAPAS